MPVWKLFSFLNNSFSIFLFSILSSAILVFSISRITNKFSLLSKQSVLPAFIFVLLTSVLGVDLSFSPIWLVAILFVIIIEYLSSTQDKYDKVKECFIAAFFLGLSSLCINNWWLIIPLFIMFLLSLQLLSSFNLIASFFGLLVPWIVLLNYYLFTLNINDFNNFIFLKQEIIKLPNNYYTIGFITIVCVYYLTSLLSVISKYDTLKIFTRHQYSLFLAGASYIIIYSLITNSFFYYLPLTAVFLSIIVSRFIDNIRSEFVANIVIIILFVITVVANFTI